MYWVIDADGTVYFDTTPHDRVMKAVAPRVVDPAMLALVKRFLEAPVTDDRDDGWPHRTRQGTPQGAFLPCSRTCTCICSTGTSVSACNVENCTCDWSAMRTTSSYCLRIVQIGPSHGSSS